MIDRQVYNAMFCQSLDEAFWCLVVFAIHENGSPKIETLPNNKNAFETSAQGRGFCLKIKINALILRC